MFSCFCCFYSGGGEGGGGGGKLKHGHFMSISENFTVISVVPRQHQGSQFTSPSTGSRGAALSKQLATTTSAERRVTCHSDRGEKGFKERGERT